MGVARARGRVALRRGAVAAAARGAHDDRVAGFHRDRRLGGQVARAPPRCTKTCAPGAPAPPPSLPWGRTAWRSASSDAVAVPSRSANARTRPLPPRYVPSPELCSANSYAVIRIGMVRSIASIGVLRVLVMWTWMPSIPSALGRAPMPQPLVS